MSRTVADSSAKQMLAEALRQAYAHAASGNRVAAMDGLARILGILPDQPEAAKLLEELSIADPAALNALLAAWPQALGVRAVAVRVYRALGNHAERLKHIEELYRRGVRAENFCLEYAAALNDNGQFNRCLQLCGDTLVMYPQSAEARRLRAGVLAALGRHAEALEDFSWIVTRQSQDVQARASIGILKLLLSDGTEGYEEYAAQAEFSFFHHRPDSLREWKGEPLKGKRLLLWSSQGIGDIVMFASLLPWALAQDGEVTLALLSKLHPLFARSFPNLRLTFLDKNLLNDPAYDFQAPLAQLMPYALPHYTPDAHPPYLRADKARAQALRQKYLAVRGRKKLVGISWLTKNADSSSRRNIPLEQWRALLALPHIQFLSLQYGDIAEAKNFPHLINDADIDAYKDTDALAAQIAACDEVITIQNATAHLAGALGVKTTLLLSAASDWRWGLKHTDSRWYKSVTIERQEKLLDWQPVLARVRARLEK